MFRKFSHRCGTIDSSKDLPLRKAGLCIFFSFLCQDSRLYNIFLKYSKTAVGAKMCPLHHSISRGIQFFCKYCSIRRFQLCKACKYTFFIYCQIHSYHSTICATSSRFSLNSRKKFRTRSSVSFLQVPHISSPALQARHISESSLSSSCMWNRFS